MVDPGVGSPMDVVVSRLRDHGSKVTGSGKQYDAQCPAHPDRNPSLSITKKADGKITLNCHTGCDTTDILRELNLEWEALFPDDTSSNARKSRVVATYDYVDRDGGLLFQAVRFDPKDFRQRQPDGQGGWTWNLRGVDRVLYRLPEVLDQVGDGWVLLVEGEKDADNLADEGFTATCNPMGAGKWQDTYTSTLRGAHVAILPDNDDEGLSHANRVARSLDGVAAKVKVVELDVPPKGDVSSWLADGHGRDELEELIQQAPVWTDEQVTSRLFAVDDLGDIPEPRWLLDGMVEHGMAMLYGPYESGKSTVSLDWSLTIAAGGRWFGKRTWTCPVVYVAAEGRAGIASRVKAWQSCRDEDPSGRWWMIGEPVNLLSEASVERLSEELAAVEAGLVIFDTLDRCTPGGSDSDEADMSTVIGHLDDLHNHLDVASLVVHHTGWDESRERGWSGFGGALDSKWRCTRDEQIVELVNDKQRNAARADGWRLAMVQRAGSVVVQPASFTDDPKAALIEAVKDRRMNIGEMTEVANGNNDLVRSLIDQGAIVSVNDRQYRHRTEAQPDQSKVTEIF